MPIGYCPGCRAKRAIVVTDTRPVSVDPEHNGLGKEIRERDYHCSQCNALIQTSEVITSFRVSLPKNHTTGCITPDDSGVDCTSATDEKRDDSGAA